MDKELESELKKLKEDRVVSEETAAIYLSSIKKKLQEESNESKNEK